ncbi:hypothetical protein BZA70DRAFT_299399 [Myxozyma melibiosi]|uniref:DNA ligase n=1 Tax=Myxozyma melibiosi TaxID=54550 RepID=A0ABR1F7U9_9ASCO
MNFDLEKTNDECFCGSRFFTRADGSKIPTKRQATLFSTSAKQSQPKKQDTPKEDEIETVAASESTDVPASTDGAEPTSGKIEDGATPDSKNDDDLNRMFSPSPPTSPAAEDTLEMKSEDKVEPEVKLEETGKKRRRSKSASRSPSPAKLPEKKAKAKKSQKKVKKEEDAEVVAKSSTLDSSDDEMALKAEDSYSALSEDEAAEELPLISTIRKTESSWPAGSPVPYSALCATFEKIEGTTKRLEIISYCSAFLLEVLELSPDSLLTIVYLFINKLGPDFEGVEIGLGEAILSKAISECTGRSLAQIKADYRTTGDLGTVARDSRNNQPTMFKPKPLTAEGVFKNLKAIANVSGVQSQAKKVGIINMMLAACQGNEAKYLVRSLEGKLRISLAEKTVLSALAQAAVTFESRKAGDKKPDPAKAVKAEEILRAVYSEIPTYDLIIPAIIKDGIMNLRSSCQLTPCVPLKPMLAKPTKSITEVLDRFSDQKFTCEYKYDGERAQIHFISESNTSRVYSRNSEDMSAKYPDIVSAIPKFLGQGEHRPSSFVLDCEAVAWDREEKRILPFQVLSTRKRKDVQEGSIKVRVCVFAFDLLYLNGKSLLQTPLHERRELLHSHFREVEGEFAYARYEDGSSVDQIQEFLDQSVKDSCEGLMVKMLEGDESGYEPSKRSRNWLKLKKDYLTGVGDSLDLVVIGAFYGKGKRTNWYGAYLLACYNPDTQEYETICRIGTGFSEEVLESLYQTLSKTVIDQPRSYYSYAQSNATAPDVWFEPTMVWEVLAADLSLSPVYKAAISVLGRGKGVSLRFPRFIRIRDDKAVDDATTSEQVSEFYLAQASASGGNQGGFNEEY